MSLFTADDIPDFPPLLDPLDDAHPRLRELDPLLRPAVDVALRSRPNADPSTVHIAPRKKWFT